ncbi:MAG: hypothetical protein WCW13_02055 [archaeon]|jgi:hypothetical protein
MSEEIQTPGLKELQGTRFIIAGRKFFDLSIPENFALLKQRNVRQVHMIFMGEVLDRGYSIHKQEIEAKLAEAGIQFTPLPKEPTSIGPFEIFSTQVSKLRKNEKALVLCYHGLHNSGAYVAYQLLKDGIGLNGIHQVFHKAGWSDGSIGTIKLILNGALKPRKTNVVKFATHWEATRKRRERSASRPAQELPPLITHAEKMARFSAFLKGMAKKR